MSRIDDYEHRSKRRYFPKRNAAQTKAAKRPGKKLVQLQMKLYGGTTGPALREGTPFDDEIPF